MDLKESFEIESGQIVYSNEGKDTLNNNGSYNDDYVEWLEAKINFTGCCETLPCSYAEEYNDAITKKKKKQSILKSNNVI